MELTQNKRPGDFILSEAPGSLSRENGILNSGQDLQAGTVLGQLISAVATNTSAEGQGNGTITVGVIGANIELGTYLLTCTAEASNAGTFSVRTPSGLFLPALTVAVPYTSTHINLTVADGAEDWNTGNTIEVVVTAGDYEALDPAEDDGAQIAAGVLYARTDASTADTACVVMKRNAELKADGLVWPEGISDANQARAIAQLEARGIFLR